MVFDYIFRAPARLPTDGIEDRRYTKRLFIELYGKTDRERFWEQAGRGRRERRWLPHTAA